MDKNTESLIDVAIREPRVNKIRLSEKAFTVIFKKEHYVGSNNIYLSQLVCALWLINLAGLKSRYIPLK